MKNLFILFFITLFIGGCSYKNEVISLQSYKSGYIERFSKEKKSVNLLSVKDMRSKKRVIGYLQKNGKKAEILYSNIDFAKKYKDGLLSALDTAGFNTDIDGADLLMEVYIKDIELVYSDIYFDENIKGKIEIEVIVKKGLKTINQNFTQKAGKWIGVSHSSKDLEPFLYELFSESINNIVSRLTKH